MNRRTSNPLAIARLHSLLAAALLAWGGIAPLWAQVEFPAPNWTVADAQAAAGQADANALLRPLYAQARRGQDPELLAGLRGLAADERLSLPAREHVLYRFALGLSDLAPGSAGPETLDYLLNYTARTLVPHPDNPRVGTPLYNVRGAASGALASWQRQAGYDAAAALLAEDGPGLAEAYLEDFGRATEPRRRGLAAALERATDEQLSGLAAHATVALSRQPDLTTVAARSALMLGDTPLLRRALAAGRGPALPAALADAAGALDEPARIDLLNGLLESAPPPNAALAIATLAPGLLHRPEIADRLFGLLGDRELGGSAALVLAEGADAALRERLQQTAQGDGLSARRAALALETAGGAL